MWEKIDLSGNPSRRNGDGVKENGGGDCLAEMREKERRNGNGERRREKEGKRDSVTFGTLSTEETRGGSSGRRRRRREAR